MVARCRGSIGAARLLSRRGRGGAPLLALPRRSLSAGDAAALVPARDLRMTDYAELQVTSNFSFLRGGSHPVELVRRARELGQRALAIADREQLAGIVRAHSAGQELDFRL